MSEQTKYNICFPLDNRSSYVANSNVEFILSVQGKKLVPGSLTICGKCAIKANSVDYPTVNQEIIMDPDAGYHALFKNFNSEARALGNIETFNNYPRFVKMKTQATSLQNSLGTQTYNCIEGKCPNEVVSRGYSYGLTAADKAVPFCIKPDIALNKSNVPLAGDQMGDIRVRTLLAPNIEVLYGRDCTVDSNYVITNLELRYETIKDDGSRPPVQMEVYRDMRQAISTNNVNLSTFVTAMADAVHISFNSVANEGAVTENYLRCLPIPGKPIGSAQAFLNNGAERVYYAINDTETALVGFTMEDRNEIVWNYLRSFNNEPKNFSNTLCKLDQPKPDGYGIGINFGTLLDFSKQKFACEIDSELSGAQHSVYLYFRGLYQL